MTATQTNTESRPSALAGAHVLITGGGRGLGRVLALGIADAGAAVGLIARSEDELAESAAFVDAAGGLVAYAATDVRDDHALGAAMAQLRDELGPFDVLINGAGISGPIGPLWEIDTHDWWTTMEINVAGTVRCTQLVLPDMIARRRGRILNLSSQAGTHRWPLVSAYSVSKAAITKLTENLAHEVSRFGISVFSVHPGLLPIGMTTAPTRPHGAHPTSYQDRIRTWIRNELAEGRGADPADAIELIVRLAAGDADNLTGRHVSVHDDLDTLLANIDDIRRRDLHTLHVQSSTLDRPTSVPDDRQHPTDTRRVALMR
jgi:NAD(P)-dependent dehydrogenase (short-subunit alcohol dehydrogenase family)